MMDREANLQKVRQLLSQHVQDVLPEKAHRQARSEGDVVTIDAMVCGLVANLLKYGGNLDQVNAYYKESGVDKDFNTMIVEAKDVIDKVIPVLRDESAKTYFGRLGEMSVVAAAIGGAKMGGKSEEPEEQRNKRFRRTAELDLGLMEFRKKLEEQGAG